MPEKSVLIFQKDRFYPVSDFEITDLPVIQKEIPYRRSSMGLNPNYVLELRDEPLKGNKTGTYRDEA